MRKRRHRPDPNQLMLFTEDEMSGTGWQDSPMEESQEAVVQPLPPPLHVMESSDSVVSLLKEVMGILDRFDDNQIRLIAMQTAALVQGGIDFSQTYRIPAIADYEFRGKVLAGLAYVSIARSFPNMTESIGLHWSEEYHEAETAYLNS